MTDEICTCGHPESLHGFMGCMHASPDFEGDEPIEDCDCETFTPREADDLDSVSRRAYEDSMRDPEEAAA